MASQQSVNLIDVLSSSDEEMNISSSKYELVIAGDKDGSSEQEAPLCQGDRVAQGICPSKPGLNIFKGVTLFKALSPCCMVCL